VGLTQQLDAIVTDWDLNQHPFYAAWRAGTLPLSTLRAYAEEYGQIVRLMPQPWQLLGDSAIAQEEVEHEALWADFARCLETSVPAQAGAAESATVIATIRRLFSEPASAIGALYAFEVQQPATATSKLDGLRQFFPQLDPALYTPYFEAHSRNWHESAALVELMQQLPAAEQELAVAACEQMCRALWDELSCLHSTQSCGM
jgi:pyrroloquinoline-quinone synthase